MQLTGGRVEANGTIFRDNRAAASGGAVSVDGGDADFMGCLFERNAATQNGGALYVRSGSVTLHTGTLLTGNEAAVAGNSMFASAGSTVMYTLPAPLGYYIDVGSSCGPRAADASKSICLTELHKDSYVNEDVPSPCAPGL